MNRVSKDKNNKDLHFLNERVIKYRKEDIVRMIVFVIGCAVIFGFVACVTFFWVRPYFSKNDSSKNVPSTAKDKNNPQNTIKSEIIYTTEEIDSTSVKEDETEQQKPVSEEEMCKSVAVIACGEKPEWTDGDSGINRDGITCGLVLAKGENIVLLTSYDKVKGYDVVTVYFDEAEGCTGRVKCKSSDYKIAIIEVDAQDIPASGLDKIKPAVFVGDEEHFISERVIFIGNLNGKKKLIANGSLTLVGNTVSIMDAAMEIMDTDIAKAGEINGFAFDEWGHVLGVALNDYSENVIDSNIVSLIRISDLKLYIDRMLNSEQISYIGIYGREVTDEVIKNIDNEMPYGIYIYNMKENSPVYLAGIMNGDVLVDIDDKKILNFDEYTECLQKYNVGQEIIVTVMRKGKDGYKQFKYTVRVAGR